MEEKILALCSGGFDSVIMLHRIREVYPDTPIETLFFDYGQKSVFQEKCCAQEVSRKLSCKFHEVKLPEFYWTSSDFYKQGFSGDKEYLEMRNLIFISYALSFCESLGCTKLFMATLKSNGYYDTSEPFLSKIRGIASDKGIELVTPFSEFTKNKLALLAFYYEIQDKDFFSCDNPVNGKPCGECPDCVTLNNIMRHASVNTPVKVWCKKCDPFDERFQELIRKSRIQEMRVLVNNDCQLKCKHCYYGFEKMKEERLSLDEFREVFKQAKSMGIPDFHFSGKEPLYDDFIFEVTRVLQEVYPESHSTVVTNGINVPKYARKLKEFNFEKVYLSVDDIEDSSGVRTVVGVTDKALRALNEVEIPVEVFIDLHQNNYNKVPKIIDFLYSNYGVKDFYVRTISLLGNAVDNIEPLREKELNEVYKSLEEYTDSNTGVFVKFNIGAPYMYDILDSGSESEIYQAILGSTLYATERVSGNFSFRPEMYCSKYECQITLTPDGFIHGCASEVSTPMYDKIAAGNVRNESLAELVKRGKKLCIKVNCNEVDERGHLKFFSCTTCSNPID